MVFYLPAREKKLRVILDWLIAAVAGRDLVNSGIDRPLGIKSVRFEPGQEILREGEVGRELFIIRRGEVEVFKRAHDGAEREVLAELGPGDHFGEVAVFEQVRRTASVRARSAVELLMVSRDAAVALSESNEGVGALLRK